jgi:cell division cycle 20-like protein 1, cofactor of APC complex
VSQLAGHDGRIGSIAWNSKFLSTGSRDKSILHRDLRSKNNFEVKLTGHKQEVCGLKWSFDEQQLASGGNDNKLMIWSLHNNQAP